MSKSLDNKEKTTYRSDKERKHMEKHKRMTRYLKSIANQKDNSLLCQPHLPLRGVETEASTSR
jgi:hypothetical protein